MKGFTLIEVLVSLLILSVVAAAGLSSISFSTQSYLTLKENFYTSTIAENVLFGNIVQNSSNCIPPIDPPVAQRSFSIPR